jgi:hypothetical protein
LAEFKNLENVLFLICVGTGTNTGVKSENHELENILDSIDDLVLDTEFIDELDFDRESIGTNLPDLDDLHIHLEESSI